MKKTMILALTLLSFQSAFADFRDPGPGPGPHPIPGYGRDRGPIGGDALPMCLKDLDNANRRASDVQRDLDNARNDNQRLLSDNARLSDDNRDLRHQLEDLQNPRPAPILSVFSYAGCKDSSGSINLNYIASAEGHVQLEAETKALQNLSQNYSCAYGSGIGKSEIIRSSNQGTYCVAGCADSTGSVNSSYIKSATGRNTTEAQYNALKALSGSYSCAYGMKIQACQNN